MKTLKIYFAHPQCTYNTILEEFALECIKTNFYQYRLQIVNPNTPIHQKRCKKEGMEYFKKLVDNCDAIFVLPFGDNTLGAGVAREIQWMIAKGGAVWILDFAMAIPFTRTNVTAQIQYKVLSIGDTRKKLQSYKYGTYHKKG